MHKIFSFIFCVSFCCIGFSQSEKPDSLLNLLKHAKNDTAKVNLLNQVSSYYLNNSPDNAINYATDAKQLAEKNNYPQGFAYALKNIGIYYFIKADYIQTLTNWEQALKKFESINDKKGIANILSNIGAVYSNEGDDAKALDYYLKALKYAEEIHDTLRIVTVLNNIGAAYFNKGSTRNKALSYYLKALPLFEKIGNNEDIGTVMVNIGEIYLDAGNDTKALEYFERSAEIYKNSKNLPYSLNDIARVYERRKDYNMALKYHQQALDIATKFLSRLDMSQSYQGIAAIYNLFNDKPKALEAYKNAEDIAMKISASYELEKIYRNLANIYGSLSDYQSAYRYQLLLTKIKDTLYNAETDKRLAFLQFNYELQKKQSEIDLLTKDQALKDSDLKTQGTVRNSLIALLTMIVLVVFILFRNYRVKSKTNKILDTQKKELEQTLDDLQNTQKQLVNSEKMASLGELTAGIAHEIQNPLNFVNNFSELNKEMITEMKEELENGNYEEVKIIADSIGENEEKINHHGKRADAIVKNMLLHSRKQAGQKEPVDINALCDEYLRLSFHGLRAKDKTFNADFKTSFDNRIGKVKIVQQDIGRVLLNLFNNAFYAITEKAKTAGESYKPMVTVTTRKITLASKANHAKEGIEIIVEDNGSGIPQNIADKIFQPFFTTKPAGQGTGLGLSMAYDIITKEHEGSIKVNSKNADGTIFVVQLATS